MKPGSSGSLALALLLAFYFLNQLWWLLCVPLGAAPDEPDHADYVNYLVRYHRLPVLGEARQSAIVALIRWRTSSLGTYYLAPDRPGWGRWEDELKTFPDGEGWEPDQYAWLAEAGQPPLAYVPPALALGPLEGHVTVVTRWQVVRLFSILFGLPAVLAGWWLGRRLWPAQAWAGGLILGTWMAALPMAAFVRSVASNDALFISLSSCLFALCLARPCRPRRDATTAGFLLAAALLAKASAVTLVPVVIAWAATGTRRARLLTLALLPAVVLFGAYALVALAGNAWHYFDFADLVFTPLETPLDPVRALHLTLGSFATDCLDGFFGRYGWVDLVRPFESQLATFLLVAFAAVGSFLPARHPEPSWRRACLWALAAVMLGLAAHFWGGYSAARELGTTTLQGRHFLYLQLPVGLLLVDGLSGLTGLAISGRRRLEVAGSLLACVIAVLCWLDLFALVATRTFPEGPPSLSGLMQGAAFESVCVMLPRALKVPLVWKGAYVAWLSAWVLLVGLLLALPWRGTRGGDPANA